MRNICFSIAIACFVCSTSLGDTKPGQPTFTNPKKAGQDFEIQGEYLGSLEDDGEDVKVGVQVIAMGDGKFKVAGYPGGLPGDGWSRGDRVERVDADFTDGVLTAKGEHGRVEMRDGKMTLIINGELACELKKIHRKSPTLGAQPPEGALVLFDGKSADGFNNGKLINKKWLGATNCESKEKFQDHTLHVEFRTPFMPKSRGQGRGNSGCYVQSRYEVQVLDSFGLEGKDNDCGGIYQISPAKVNMCLPPLSWQTYDIDFTAAKYDADGKKTANARVTVKHNGVVIHDDLELPKQTPGRHIESPDPDAVFFQDHGNPVAFRNIWVVKK